VLPIAFRRAVVAGLTATLAATVLPNPTAHAADTGRVCKESTVPVTLEPATYVPGSSALAGSGGRYELFVRFCQPKAKPSTTVQVLVHGITYDHRYWNIPDPDGTDRYSWEAAAAKAGYATLAIDRLGAGGSSHPPSPQVDINTNASAVRALIHALREGNVPNPAPGTAVEKVVLVGHSYGSMTSWFAASDNSEVDALVVTGATHNVREIGTPLEVSAPLYPAVLDPAYASSGYDPGYLTIRPGTRAEPYYAPDTNYDKRVLAADEAIKGTVTFWELNNYPLIFRTRLNISAPVFLLIGTKDGIFCSLQPGDMGAPCDSEDKLIANEKPWLGAEQVDAHLVYGAGHAINAVRTSQESFGAVQKWVRRTLGSGHDH
jgi:pimeloyl-ACP methyl ester carboxylesterase